MSESGKDFPDWETLYKSQKIETMPWYNENFDSYLEKELDERLLMMVNSLTLVLVQRRKQYGLLREDLRSWVLIYLKLRLTDQEKFMLMRKVLNS
jgi:hypothetical protein